MNKDHAIRNQLTVIRLCTGLLQTSMAHGGSDQDQETVRIMEIATDKLESLVL